MPDTKISALTALTGASVAADDLFAIVDTSVTETKKITIAEHAAALLGSVQSTIGTDAIIRRAGAASLALGAADAAAPVAQTLGVQSVVAGTSNTAGTNFTIKGSAGTGTGAGGSIVFQVAPAGSTGTAQNSFSTALTIDSTTASAFAGDIYLGTAKNGPRFNAPSTSTLDFYVSSTTNAARLSSARFAVLGELGIGSSTGPDVLMARDAANTLALRNGTNAQTSRVYGTYTDASNYRRLALTMSTAGVAELKPEGAGTGASGNVIHISGLPTSNPGPGILWNNAGTPAIGT